MKRVDMRKLPAAAQEERRRQVIGLRQAGQMNRAGFAGGFNEILRKASAYFAMAELDRRSKP